MTKDEILALPNLTLAYIGDAIFELMVRERLVQKYPTTNTELHRMASKKASAEGQSRALEELLPLLSEEEKRVYLRGRNAKLSVSKRSNPAANCRATGLEALFGYLYLNGEKQRLEQLMEMVFDVENSQAGTLQK